MLRNLLILLLSASALLAASAEKVLVWEASSPNLPGKVFLAGSVHVGRAAWYPLDSAYDKALNASSAVYFEIFRPDSQQVIASCTRYGIFPQGKKLSDAVGMDNFRKINNLMLTNNSPLVGEALERMRPWLLTIEVATIYLRKHPDLAQNFGFEAVFTQNLGDKPGYSLESVDLQFRTMSGISEFASMRVLMEGVNDFKNAGRDLERIMESITTGNPQALSLLNNEVAFKHPEFYQKLFADRNKRMAGMIYDLMKKKQTVFVLVGAGHFVGRDNILELLREKGCTTVQLDKTGKKGELRPRG